MFITSIYILAQWNIISHYANNSLYKLGDGNSRSLIPPKRVPMSVNFLLSNAAYSARWDAFSPAIRSFKVSTCCRCSPAKNSAFNRKSSCNCSAVAIGARSSQEGDD